MFPPKKMDSSDASGGLLPAGTSLACAATSVAPGIFSSHPAGSRETAVCSNGESLRPVVLKV
jgi:hypothetical protein